MELSKKRLELLGISVKDGKIYHTDSRGKCNELHPTVSHVAHRFRVTVCFSHEGKHMNMLVNRIVYAWEVGPIQKGEDIIMKDYNPLNYGDKDNLILVKRSSRKVHYER